MWRGAGAVHGSARSAREAVGDEQRRRADGRRTDGDGGTDAHGHTARLRSETTDDRPACGHNQTWTWIANTDLN